MIDDHDSKLIRIDENVKTLLKVLPLIENLKEESAVNKRDHRFAAWIFGFVIAPIFLILSKLLNLDLFR